MHKDSDKIILFPTWQKNLEQESLRAMRNKKYDEALEKINKLLHFNVENHELYIAKLICLMELKDHNGALELSERMLEKEDENYFQYVHIYLTVLFQMGCYEQLIDHVQYEFSNNKVPAILAEQFEKLQEASESLFEEMKIQQGVEYMQQFQEAIQDRAFEKQWQILSKIRNERLHIHDQIIRLLANDQMHPVIQTAIFLGLQENMIRKSVTVQKLGMKSTFIPATTPSIESDPVIQQIELLFEDVEQEDPVLFNFMKQMLYRYAFVRYPFSFEINDAYTIADAIRIVAEKSLNVGAHTYDRSGLSKLIEEIEMSVALYLSVVQE